MLHCLVFLTSSYYYCLDILTFSDIYLVNKGSLAEVFAGLELIRYQSPQSRGCIIGTGNPEGVFTVTKDYTERIQALKSLPAKNRENLISIVDSIKADLSEIK